ncbi:hypothetical protein ACH5RR_022955 [Cinchona calisaya]|uniref:Uncharacterized protein n=1 Tax=Cinchona calisaya TaxID=153742 RepID=A0ABD2ZAC1_9GENT
MNYGLTENYFISSFLGGLKADIRLLVRKPKPVTLYLAFNLARIQEIASQLEKEKFISSRRRNMGENTFPSNCMNVYVNLELPAQGPKYSWRKGPEHHNF